MKDLFGDDYKNIAVQYGKTSTESEIREAIAKSLSQFRKENLAGGAFYDFQAYLREFYFAESVLIPEVKQTLGTDNVDDIERISDECIETERAYVEGEMHRLNEEQKQKELEAIKSHPDYKEVPASIETAFKALGITVKTNLTRMVIPGFRGRKGIPVEPFQKWYFKDETGYDGVLRKVSGILKSRYHASFFQDAGDAFHGAWWHVPSTVDLAEIYELLAD